MSSKSSLLIRTLSNSNNFSPGCSGMPTTGTANSPMSSLAMNFTELSTGRGTPKRRLSLSSLDTPTGSITSNPTPERMSSVESGCFVDSPTPLDSPTLEMSLKNFSNASRLYPNIPPEAYGKKKTIAFRKLDSSPVSNVDLGAHIPSFRLSPIDYDSDEKTSPSTDTEKENTSTTDSEKDSCVSSMSEGSPEMSPPKKICISLSLDDSCSQDSGVGMDKENEFQFAAPVGIPPRRLRLVLDEDTCSPNKYSPVKYDLSPSKNSPSLKRTKSVPTSLDFSSYLIRPLPKAPTDSPQKLKTSALTSFEDDVDDGFLDVLDGDICQVTDTAPTCMTNLFSAPLLNSETEIMKPPKPLFSLDNDTPISRKHRRVLSRSQSFDVRTRLPSTKRTERPKEETTPVQNKRRKPHFSPTEDEEFKKPASRFLVRCRSETEATIKSAIDRLQDQPHLIADCSKPYTLPTVPGKHQDLKCITPETLSDVLNGAYSHEIEKFLIIDCRYPYEYEGGHIQNALNLYTKESIMDKLLKHPINPANPSKRVIIIFHCEFSSERGPNLSRFLRNRDRDANKDCYPYLDYPELYLLEGGYKAFFELSQNHCEPKEYKPMLHKDHSQDLKHFRAKSKSWAGERSSRPGLRSLKF